jgi:hypothetical protein
MPDPQSPTCPAALPLAAQFRPHRSASRAGTPLAGCSAAADLAAHPEPRHRRPQPRRRSRGCSRSPAPSETSQAPQPRAIPGTTQRRRIVAAAACAGASPDRLRASISRQAVLRARDAQGAGLTRTHLDDACLPRTVTRRHSPSRRSRQPNPKVNYASRAVTPSEKTSSPERRSARTRSAPCSSSTARPCRGRTCPTPSSR